MKNNKGQALIEAVLVICFCFFTFLFFAYLFVQSLNIASSANILNRLNYCLSSYNQTQIQCLIVANKKLKQTCLFCTSPLITYKDKKLLRQFTVIWKNALPLRFIVANEALQEVKNEYEFKK